MRRAVYGILLDEGCLEQGLQIGVPALSRPAGSGALWQMWVGAQAWV